jgi:glutamate transport system ATP-binding protein
MGKTTAVRVVRDDREPLVIMDAVNKHYGELHVLNDINTQVGRGEVVVVLGPSGSGKSTLCRAINRLETIDSGTITIDGVPLPEEGKGLAKLRADVGMVFQAFNLFAHKTILENVTLGPVKVRGLGRKAAEERAMALLDRVGIADQARKLPSQLSGGQQQRAAIARSLAMEPKLILLDEPTSALDPEMINEVLDVMIGLAQGRRPDPLHGRRPDRRRGDPRAVLHRPPDVSSAGLPVEDPGPLILARNRARPHRNRTAGTPGTDEEKVGNDANHQVRGGHGGRRSAAAHRLRVGIAERDRR